MSARILKPTAENIALAAEALRRGEVVGMPTETVYGLAGSALDPIALARIFETKERPTFDPLIVHVEFLHRRVAALEAARLVDGKTLSPRARERADKLMEAFWPGPLTLVLPKNESVPDLATSGLPTVALRMPRHPVAQALIASSGRPLAAPSANRFGRISPTQATDVQQELGDRIDWILDGGACEVGVESTILAISEQGALRLLRPGGLPVEEIERVTGSEVERPLTSSTRIEAPGMLESHYAPRKRLILLPKPLLELEELPPGISPGCSLLSIALNSRMAQERWEKLGGKAHSYQSLSEQGDLSEAARNLFGTLRTLDASDCSAIVAEPCSDTTGLGYAIGDRLRRAAAPR